MRDASTDRFWTLLTTHFPDLKVPEINALRQIFHEAINLSDEQMHLLNKVDYDLQIRIRAIGSRTEVSKS